MRHDGGTSYVMNVEASMALRMPSAGVPSFSAFPKDVQKRVLESELGKLGVRCADNETLATLTKKFADAGSAANTKGLAAQLADASDDVGKRQREGRSLAMGLDGRVMSDEELEQYELGEAEKTLTAGTTLGSAMAIGTVLSGGDVEQMRQGSELGNMLTEPASDIGQHHLMHPHAHGAGGKH